MQITGGCMQSELFHDDIYSALDAAIMALGGYKKVAGWLFSNKTLDTAYAHLKNCMREDKSEKLSPHELLMIMQAARDIGVHDVMNYLADAANYQRPQTLEPKDEMMELQKRYIEAAKAMQHIAQRIERVQIKAAS